MSESRKPAVILMAEDDEDDVMLAEDALREARLSNRFICVPNGAKLLEYLRHQGEFADRERYPEPSIILLDLNMPILDGRKALQIIKEDEALCRIPVVVLTTSQAEEDILRSYQLGVNSYIRKPVTFDGLVKVVQVLGSYWFEIVELPGERR
ncbi:response regulator [Endothiovibrio diazotrophicus]